MKIGLLQCDNVPEDFLPIAGDYPQMFAALFAETAPELVLEVFDVRRGEYPGIGDIYDGFISTGSHDSVYDLQPWILDFKRFVQRLFAGGQKFVGICFGHQMIAEALDGTCTPAPGGWEVGPKAAKIFVRKPWMLPEPPASQFRLNSIHRDQVTALPAGAEVLAGYPGCPYAMIAVGPHFLGIQAHPEFNDAYVAALMQTRAAKIGAEKMAAAQAEMARPLDQALLAKWIVNFFRG